MRKIHLIVIACFLMFIAANLCSAASNVNGVLFHFRENGVSKSLHLPSIPAGVRYNISNNQTEVCTPSAPSTHTTTAGRRFEHIHTTFTLPAGGLEIYDEQTDELLLSITSAKIQAYWDHKYGTLNDGPPYSGGSGVTYNCNCWGYAFGYNCWVEDPEYIYNDNYDQAPINPSSIPQGEMVVKKSGHAQKLTELSMSFTYYAPPTYLKKETVEKNLESGIYTQYWSGTGTPISHTMIYIKK